MEWENLERLPTLGAAQISRDGILTRCNDAFARIIGDDSRHLIGRHFITDLTGVADRTRAEADLDALLKRAVESVANVRTIRRPDGTVTAASFCAIIPDGQDEVLAFMWRNPVAEDTDHLKSHIAQLEQVLALVLKNANSTHGVVLNVAGNDNSQNVSASNHSEASVGSRNTSMPQEIKANGHNIVFLAVVVGSLMTLVLGLVGAIAWLMFR